MEKVQKEFSLISSEDIGEDKRIILKRILNKYGKIYV
jgi:hypothetical protein